MKVIAFGDLYMATSMLLPIDALLQANLIIPTYDLTNFGNRKKAKRVPDDIQGSNRKLLCLAGNMDNSEVSDYLDDRGMNLHGCDRLATSLLTAGMLAGGSWATITFDDKAFYSNDFIYKLP